MFRRTATTFFSFLRSWSWARVYATRITSEQRRKLLGGFIGVQFGAATAVALTDAQLKKKPEWYQHAVIGLEDALRKTSTFGYIESEEVLEKLHETLQRVADISNTELLWRMVRVLVERADLIRDRKKQEEMYREAKEYALKALAVEPAKGCAGAHKWYAIVLNRLTHINKKEKYEEEILRQLERAVLIEPSDPHAWLLLGVAHRSVRNYEDAIKSHMKAEEIKPNFSASNLYHLGAAQQAARKKADAIESYKRCLMLHAKYTFDGRAKLEAKKALMAMKVKPEEFEPQVDEY